MLMNIAAGICFAIVIGVMVAMKIFMSGSDKDHSGKDTKSGK